MGMRLQRLGAAIVGLTVVGAAGGVSVAQTAAQSRKAVEHKLMWEGTVPTRQTKPIPPLKTAKQVLAPFKSAPFPFDGTTPHSHKNFFDVVDAQGRRGHASSREMATLWEDQTYNDNRVLLHLPKGFTPSKPSLMVVFLHGNRATLERDVIARQRVPEQVAAARINAVLVAPQLAYDAADSSAGRFWEPGAFKAFLAEAAIALARLHGHDSSEKLFRRMPVVLMAYSGGYQPAAYILHHGGSADRIRGVVLLDGLYGEQSKYADWIAQRRKAFFVSAYTQSSSSGNEALRHALEGRNIPTLAELDGELSPGDVAIVAAEADATHGDFVTKAWADNPIADVLSRAALHARYLK